MLFILGVEMEFMRANLSAPEYKADHPFMIMIMQKANKLFIGHILNPNPSANTAQKTTGVKKNDGGSCSARGKAKK